MIKWIANLAPWSEVDCTGLVFATDVVTQLSPTGLRLGRADIAHLTVDTIHELMTAVEQIGLPQYTVLSWDFSSVSVRVDEIPELLTVWNATHEPPVLSIISLVLGDSGHLTQGLSPFTGFELSTQFRKPGDAREAARNMALLARYAMRQGALIRQQNMKPSTDRRCASTGPKFMASRARLPFGSSRSKRT